MVKLFERDFEALEEIHIKPTHQHMKINAYSDGDFTLSIYEIPHSGEMSLIETVASNSENVIILDIERYPKGEMVVNHIAHGDDDFTTVAEDSIIIPSDTVSLVLITNESATVCCHGY